MKFNPFLIYTYYWILTSSLGLDFCWACDEAGGPGLLGMAADWELALDWSRSRESSAIIKL